MSFPGGKQRFQPYKIAAYIPVKFFLRPDRALSARTGLILTSLTWGPHPLPMGLSFCPGCIAGVPASSCSTAVDVSGQGPTPNLASWLQSCSAMALPRHTRGCVWPWLHSLGLILNPTDILLAWPEPIPVLVPREVPSAWGWGYPPVPHQPCSWLEVGWAWLGGLHPAAPIGTSRSSQSPGCSWPLWYFARYLRLSQALA